MNRTYSISLAAGLTVCFLPACLSAADVSFYKAEKSQTYQQTGPATVIRANADKFFFQATVYPAPDGTVGNATVALPNGTQEYTLSPGNPFIFIGSSNSNNAQFSSLAELNSYFPDGTYTLNISTLDDGTLRPSLDLTGDAWPVSVPQLSNFTAAQAITATNDFTFTWFPFYGATTNDYIGLSLYDTNTLALVFQTAYPGAPGALNGASNSVVIPANTLVPGASYLARLYFAKVVATNATDYPGATGYALYSYSTLVNVAALGYPPAVVSQPQSQTALIGSNIAFTVSASGTAPLAYQWRFNGGMISGGTSTALTILNSQLTNAGSYDVVVTNSWGGATSQVATLVFAPRIIAQPQSQGVLAGSNVTFTVSATGTPPLSYQWQFNGEDISGATSNAYTIYNSQLADAGSYDVVVTNSWGAATSQVATLNLAPPGSTTGWGPVPGWWGLYGWINLFYVPTPNLGVAKEADRVTLSWPSAYSDGVLLTTTSLTPPVTWAYWTIQSNATSTLGDRRLFSIPATDAQRFFLFYHSQLFCSIPVFQFAIFYNSLLEFTWCAPYTVNGRTHANGNIYVGSIMPLTFNTLVTTIGTISSPAWFGHQPSDYTATVTYNAGYRTNTEALVLPIGTDNTPDAMREIINPPPAGEDPNSPMGQQRYYNKAGVVLLVSNSTVTVTLKCSPSDPQATNITAFYYPTNSSLTNYTQLTTNFPFLNITNFFGTGGVSTNYFTDQREGDSVKATDIDVSILKRWLVTNAVVNGKFSNTSGVYSVSNAPNILYAADNRTYTSGQLTAIRLKNAQTIPTNLVTIAGNTQPSGFTVATPNPLYVWGHYNCPNNAHLGTTNTTSDYPASLVSDALTILSGKWTDAHSNDSFGTGVRVAQSTTINAAILTGVVYSTGSSDTQFSGGVQNLPRLLEDWGNGSSSVVLTLNTSVVNFFNSVRATSQFRKPGVYYYAPTRQFSFDLNFLDYTKQPPGTPMLVFP